MTVEELRTEIASGALDTVVIAMTDMQGRLVGKRVHGQYFLDEVLKHKLTCEDPILFHWNADQPDQTQGQNGTFNASEA